MSARGGSDPMRWARPLGWAALAAAPVLLVTLAVAASRPDVPAATLRHAGWAASTSGGLALVAAALHERGIGRLARVLAGIAAAIVVGWCGFAVWLSTSR